MSTTASPRTSTTDTLRGALSSIRRRVSTHVRTRSLSSPSARALPFHPTTFLIVGTSRPHIVSLDASTSHVSSSPLLAGPVPGYVRPAPISSISPAVLRTPEDEPQEVVIEVMKKRYDESDADVVKALVRRIKYLAVHPEPEPSDGLRRQSSSSAESGESADDSLNATSTSAEGALQGSVDDVLLRAAQGLAKTRRSQSQRTRGRREEASGNGMVRVRVVRVLRRKDGRLEDDREVIRALKKLWD